MIPRYVDDEIATIWSDHHKHELWTRAAAAWARSRGFIETADALISQSSPPMHRIRELEEYTHHDVAAWLQAWTEMYPTLSNGLHRGLTSSDLVEFSHWWCLYLSTGAIWNHMDLVSSALGELEDRHSEGTALAYTHGQPAEPVSIRSLFYLPKLQLTRAINAMSGLYSQLRVTKTPGAVGTSPFHSPAAHHRFSKLTQTNIVSSTQVINRVRQVEWATTVIQAVIVCEQIAMEYRTRARHGEWRRQRDEDHVASSAMPHKNNPIEAETITGLCRLARAQIAPIMESAVLMDHRDMSNSSVERVAVVDLCHLATTIARRTRDLLTHLTIDMGQVRVNLHNARPAIYSSELLEATLAANPTMPYREAHRLVRDWINGGPLPSNVDWESTH